MDVRVGLWRRLSTEELMLLNCGVGEDPRESLELQGDPTSPLWRRSALDFLRRNDAKAETPVLWPPHAKSWLIGKDSDVGGIWDRRKRGRQRMRWLDGITGWTWVWVNSRSLWWTGRPGVLRFMESQRVGHDGATELNWFRMRSGIELKLLLRLGCVCAKSLQSCATVTLWAVACQAPLSMGFSRQEFWSGLPCPPPAIFLTQGLNLCLMSPALASGVFTTRATWEAHFSGWWESDDEKLYVLC